MSPAAKLAGQVPRRKPEDENKKVCRGCQSEVFTQRRGRHTSERYKQARRRKWKVTLWGFALSILIAELVGISVSCVRRHIKRKQCLGSPWSGQVKSTVCRVILWISERVEFYMGKCTQHQSSNALKVRLSIPTFEMELKLVNILTTLQCNKRVYHKCLVMQALMRLSKTYLNAVNSADVTGIDRSFSVQSGTRSKLEKTAWEQFIFFFISFSAAVENNKPVHHKHLFLVLTKTKCSEHVSYLLTMEQKVPVLVQTVIQLEGQCLCVFVRTVLQCKISDERMFVV